VAVALTAPPRIIDVLDATRKTVTRVTTPAMSASAPVWSPDGAELAVNVRGDNRLDLYRVPANGAGAPRLVLKTLAYPLSWHEGVLLFQTGTSAGPAVSDLMTIEMDKDGATAKPYITGPPIKRQGQFAPDGRAVAYASNESGAFEVYVSSFPDPMVSKATISSGGGSMPRWSRDGKELFYFAPDDTLFAVPISRNGTQITPSARTPLFKAPVVRTSSWAASWDVSADGRFLINVPGDPTKAPPATLVLNWQSGLRK
jgi:Tol biopolymer transport system component